jgi:hypothetical protein
MTSCNSRAIRLRSSVRAGEVRELDQEHGDGHRNERLSPSQRQAGGEEQTDRDALRALACEATLAKRLGDNERAEPERQ